MSNAAVSVANSVTQSGAASAPILRLSAVNITSGTMRKRKRKAKMTWTENQQLAVTSFSPYQMVTIAAGVMAIARVDQTTRPGRKANIDKPLHHNLTRECCGHRGIQPAT